MKTFSPKLDALSENIIYLHSLNSRSTISDLAKKLKVNRKIVEHRTKKLYRNGIIKPLLVYNHRGLTKATILVKLSIFDRQVINAILQLKKLVKLKETLGKYDLSLLVITENQKELDMILSKVNTLLHHRILGSVII
ncbi:Lrp/AsnC family transcriptional regulator [Candidatus Woesearchaeota archaeon]|nr:Lrp/AsnC family transcriptional regulator [Candidatus Woesearchaeota archaeon]